MPATPQQIQFEDKDFEERADYSDLEHGEEYIGFCTDVEDAEASTGNIGWRFTFDVKGLPVRTTVWLKGGGKWRVREIFNALGYPISPADDVSSLDPNVLIGGQCVVTIEKSQSDDGREWTNVGKTTPYISEPAVDFSDLET